MPAIFFAASATCWYDPTKAPAIAFFLFGCGMVFFDSVASYFTKPAADGLSKAMTDFCLSFSDEKNEEQTDKLLDALADSILRALQSGPLKSTLKQSIVEIATDDDLTSAAIQTIQDAMKKAADNADFKDTLFDITKRAFVGALNDESFIKESLESGVAAIVVASQDEILRASMLSVVTQAVSDALHDEQLISEFQEVVKACLSDGEMYRSGARGVISAAFGGKGKKSESEKQVSSSNVVKKSDDS